MKGPRNTTRCRRCGVGFLEHVGMGPERTRVCPVDGGGTFLRHTPRPAVMRFVPPELEAIETSLRNSLHAGGSAAILLRLLGRFRSHRERMMGTAPARRAS